MEHKLFSLLLEAPILLEMARLLSYCGKCCWRLRGPFGTFDVHWAWTPGLNKSSTVL